MKQDIRKKILALRDGMPPEARREKSRKIEEKLFSLPEFRSAGAVMLFASFRSEVETDSIIRRALGAGKRVILPKVRGTELALFEIRDFRTDVAPGAWGIPEPAESLPVQLNDIDCIIVPGAAFDERGNRLGYGAGFYDKLLPAFAKATVALAFEEQIVSAVPADPHDVPIKLIVTEKRIIKTSSNI